MSVDSEIDLLRRRKLLKLRRRLLLEGKEALRKSEDVVRAVPKPREALKKVFVGRAWEVWEAAEAQYPAFIKRVAEVLATLINSGRLKGEITGEQLYWFFKRLGLRVRLKTRIRIYENGELKSIADKLREDK